MANRMMALAVLAVASAASVGCASGGDLQRRVDELTAENEELHRQKAQVESDLLSSQARVDQMERDRKSAPRPVAGVTGTPYDGADLKGGGLDIRRRGNETIVSIPSDVTFGSGSSALSAAGAKTMSQVSDYLRKNHPKGLIRVEGHSDSDPIRRTKDKYRDNWDLSYQRAYAVMKSLIDKGKVDAGRLVCEAWGEHHPVDPANKSKNRRVEIVVSPAP